MEFLKRKPNRLKNYDYSKNGAYFITLCVKDKTELLWKNTTINELSSYGQVINDEISKLNKIYINSAVVEKYVIMPNHIHMIIMLHGDDINSCNNPSISHIIQQFKGSITKQIGFSLWQKLFYDRVIRNKQEYKKIWQYIDNNPLKWDNDCFNKNKPHK